MDVQTDVWKLLYVCVWMTMVTVSWPEWEQCVTIKVLFLFPGLYSYSIFCYLDRNTTVATVSEGLGSDWKVDMRHIPVVSAKTSNYCDLRVTRCQRDPAFGGTDCLRRKLTLTRVNSFAKGLSCCRGTMVLNHPPYFGDWLFVWERNLVLKREWTVLGIDMSFYYLNFCFKKWAKAGEKL